MVNRDQGKLMMKKVVERYHFVEETPDLIKNGLLSEQDITTKFVLPMLETLNWSTLRITPKGPEIHEKAYRKKSDVGKGLPDVILQSGNGVVFVEVKRPPLGRKGTANLERYEDADLIVLTSFEDLKVYTRYKGEKPKLRKRFRFKDYVTEFRTLWNILSNTEKGRNTRAAYKATR